MVLTPAEIALGRRNFMKAMAGVPPLLAFGAAAALRGPRAGGPVKAGFIGPGRQGKVLLGQCRKEFIDLRAVCDINPQRLDEASDSLVKLGWPAPRKYEEWRDMLAREDIEAVIIATPLRAGLLGEIHHARLMYHRNRSWRRDTPPPSADYSPARWGYPTWDHLVNWRLYRKYSQGLVAELGGHQISTANLFLDSSPTAVLGSGGMYRFKDREVNDHVFVTLEYPQGRTVTFSSIEPNDFDHITEQFMGTRGTLIIGREGETLLFGNDDRPTGIEITERTDNAVLDASESRVADAAGRRADSAARPAGAGSADDGLLPYRLEIATFCSAIRTGQALQCGVDMAFKTTVACLAANQAMDTRQRVEVPGRA